MNEEEGGILSFLDKVVEIESVPQPILEETIPDEEPEEEIEFTPRDYREKSYESLLCELLTQEGYQYERQKKTANGIIDIFVYDRIPWIVEVKRSGTSFYLIQAIAQLKFYAMCFSFSQLYVAVPGRIKEEYLPILEEFRISEFRGP